jgi:hypothetical protein
LDPTNIVKSISEDIVKNRYFYSKFKHYLVDKNIHKKYWPLIIGYISRIPSDEIRYSIYDLVPETINDLVHHEENFIICLEILSSNEYYSKQLPDMIDQLEATFEKLFILYKKMISSKEKTVRLCSNRVLGLIGDSMSLFAAISNSIKSKNFFNLLS